MGDRLPALRSFSGGGWLKVRDPSHNENTIRNCIVYFIVRE